MGERKPQITVSYDNTDTGLYLYCDGIECNPLGFWPSVEEIVEAKRKHLEEHHG